jgi:hypothetical protein
MMMETAVQCSNCKEKIKKRSPAQKSGLSLILFSEELEKTRVFFTACN